MTDAVARTFLDEERTKVATTDRHLSIGPAERSYCAHGQLYGFRYEWPKGSGGPHDGWLFITDNHCIDCALEIALQAGTRRKL